MHLHCSSRLVFVIVLVLASVILDCPVCARLVNLLKNSGINYPCCHSSKSGDPQWKEVA